MQIKFEGKGIQQRGVNLVEWFIVVASVTCLCVQNPCQNCVYLALLMHVIVVLANKNNELPGLPLSNEEDKR